MTTGRWDEEFDDAEFATGVGRGASGIAHMILFGVAGFFIVFLLWAHHATLDEVTRGDGKIVPFGQTKIVQHFEGGIVTDILIEEGQIVDANEVLMRVENQDFESDRADKQQQYFNLLAKGARLESETRGLERIRFPETLQEKAPAVARNEEILFERRQLQLNQQTQILSDQRNQKIAELRELEAKVGQLGRQLELSKQEEAILEPLVRQGAASQVELLRIRREIQDLESQVQGVELAIPRTRSSVSEADRRIDEKTASFVAEAQQELNEVRVQAAAIQEEIRAAVDRQQRSEVRSPVRGTVNKMLINTIGGVVKAGDPILEIVPLGDKLIVEAKVRPSDRAALKEGLPATVKISAYDFTTHGGLDAVLFDISADTIVDEEGESFYRIRLRTDQNNLGEDKPIIPGMTATVDILTGGKTVLQYLLKPIIKSKTADRVRRNGSDQG